MIPSWTETLIECGIDVVGRTRFCVHPAAKISQIAVVGGTKDIHWDKVKALQPDLLLLDKEENLKSMAEQSPCDLLISHVTDLESVIHELEQFSKTLSQGKGALRGLKARYEAVLKRPVCSLKDFSQIPGEIHCLRRDYAIYQNIVYVIWRDPWMRVGPKTYIGSVISHLGMGPIPPSEVNYPKFEISDWDLKTTYFLFSSEPFPFAKKIDELRALNVQGSIVDGEMYSWFGIRGLKFLENITGFA